MFNDLIPPELFSEMNCPDTAVYLGWSRNFGVPNGRHHSQDYPGWNLLKEHCSAADVADVLNAHNKDFNRTAPSDKYRPTLDQENWDDLEEAIFGDSYPILDGLLLLLAKALNKGVYVTTCVSTASGFDSVQIHKAMPDGNILLIKPLLD